MPFVPQPPIDGLEERLRICWHTYPDARL